MIIGTGLGWSNGQTIALAVGLAFLFGYALTMRPLLRSGLALGVAVKLALAADTVSIAVMELVDNLVMSTCRVRWTRVWPTGSSGLHWPSL